MGLSKSCHFYIFSFIVHILYCPSSPPPIWNHKSNFAAKCEFMAKSGICDNFPQNVNLWQSPEQTIERPICPCRRSIFLLGIFGKFIQTFAYTDTLWNSDFRSYYIFHWASFTVWYQKYSYLIFKFENLIFEMFMYWWYYENSFWHLHVRAQKGFHIWTKPFLHWLMLGKKPRDMHPNINITRYPNINKNYKQPCVQTLRKRSIYMNPNSNTTKYPYIQTSAKIQTLKLQEKEIYTQTTVFKCSSQRHW